MIALQVVRAAEECGTTLAKVVPFEQTISILNPISLTADFPINLAAIKLETKVIQSGTGSSVRAIMPVITPGLVKVNLHFLDDSNFVTCKMSNIEN